MGACGYVLSCVALNDLTIRGPQILGHLPDTGDPWAWLTGAQACVESVHKELDQANRWQDAAPPSWPLRWDYCGSCLGLVLLSWWSLPFSQEWWNHI
jgi:hypothetical protein